MKKKIQVTVEISMLDWFKNQAEIYGVSVSGLVNISMAEYRMQKETVGNIPQMIDIMNTASSVKKDGIPGMLELMNSLNSLKNNALKLEGKKNGN